MTLKQIRDGLSLDIYKKSIDCSKCLQHATKQVVISYFESRVDLVCWAGLGRGLARAPLVKSFTDQSKLVLLRFNFMFMLSV